MRLKISQRTVTSEYARRVAAMMLPPAIAACSHAAEQAAQNQVGGNTDRGQLAGHRHVSLHAPLG